MKIQIFQRVGPAKPIFPKLRWPYIFHILTEFFKLSKIRKILPIRVPSLRNQNVWMKFNKFMKQSKWPISMIQKNRNFGFNWILLRKIESLYKKPLNFDFEFRSCKCILSAKNSVQGPSSNNDLQSMILDQFFAIKTNKTIARPYESSKLRLWAKTKFYFIAYT